MTDFDKIGGLEGARLLANTFYDLMDERADFKAVRDIHPQDLQPVKDNFTLFLSGWLGGPKLYQEKFGKLDLTGIHASLEINAVLRDIWLCCMGNAIQKHNMDSQLKKDLIARFKIAAERIRGFCKQQIVGLPMHDA